MSTALVSPTTAPPTAERLGKIMHGAQVGDLKSISDAAACLIPLLNALGWQGTPRSLAEALPHFASSLDVDGLCQILANLNYPCSPVKTRLGGIEPRLFPCLFAPDKGPVMVVYERHGTAFTVFDGAKSNFSVVEDPNLRGVAYVISQATEKQTSSTTTQRSWFLSVALRFKTQIIQLLAISFLVNLLALTMPIFIMTVYDRVIGTKSIETLSFLLMGVGIALVCDFALRAIRARLLAFIGARIDMVIGCAAFNKVLDLSLPMIERATVGSQISRLRQFEAVREFFTGQLAGVALDLPFVVVFIVVITVLGGPLGLIPIVLFGIFLASGLIIVPATRDAMNGVSEARMKRQGFLVEMLTYLRDIKTCAGEGSWSSRFRDISARCATMSYEASQISVRVQAFAQFLMLTAGIATIGLGTLQVLNGAMTIGALVACMMLVWRVLTPLQVLFLNLGRFEQMRIGLKRIDQLMRMETDRSGDQGGDYLRRLLGEVAFSRVSIRYAGSSDPALLGVDFRARPGEIVAITGDNGSGKSTVLKMIAGLYKAQAGAVLIDGMDIRQIDPAELRGAIASVPQASEFFHGTIAQNLRLANPTASDDDLVRAARDANILDEILALPEGFETRLTDSLQRHLSTGMKQGIMLARAYVKDAPIYLLDEPGNNLDWESDQVLIRKLESLRGKATIFAITHRPSHLRIADRVIVMDAGRVLLNGSPDDVLPQLKMY